VIIQQIKKYKGHLSEFGWIALGKGLSFAGMMFLVSLLTKSLTTYDYGILALGLTFCNLANQVIMGSISQGIGRYFSIVLESGGYHSFKHAAVKISGLASATLFLFGILSAVFFFFEGQFNLVNLVFALIILSVMNGLNDIFNSMQNIARNRMHMAITGAIDAWLKVLLVGVVLNYVTASATEVILCYIATAALILLIQIDKWKKFHKSLVHDDEPILNWEKEIWRFSLPASIWGIFVWFQQASDKWVLQLFSNTNDVAQYSVLYQVGYTPLIIGIGLLVTMCTPILYRKSKLNDDGSLDTQDHKIIVFLCLLIFIVTTAAFMLLWLFNAQIMRAVAAPAYYISSTFLPWMALGAGFFAFADVLYIKMMGEIRVKEILVVKILASSIGVAYNSLGAYFFGLWGVVAANVLFGITYLVIIYAVSLKIFSYQNFLDK
jgi:O-antigen/teichoic acid export membrane protein